MLILSCGLILLLSRIFKWDKNITGCLLLLIPLGNTSFLGIPMVKAFFGGAAVNYALLYDQLGSFLALAIYGSFIVAVYNTDNNNGNMENRITILPVLKKVITFPPFIALIVAFISSNFTYPDVIENILAILSATLVPLVMIAVGYQLQFKMDKKLIAPLGIGLSVKLIIAPLVALMLCKLLGFKGQAAQVSIFEAGMPPMVSAGALAILAKLSPALTAALVGIGILLSFITLPILYQIII
jgi:predicted permease